METPLFDRLTNAIMIDRVYSALGDSFIEVSESDPYFEEVHLYFERRDARRDSDSHIARSVDPPRRFELTRSDSDAGSIVRYLTSSPETATYWMHRRTLLKISPTAAIQYLLKDF